MHISRRTPLALAGLLLLACLPLAAADTVKIGGKARQAQGIVTNTENGDIACYIHFRDDRGEDFMELGDFDLCFHKPPLVGKRVAFTYKMANVLAASCQGNVDCGKSDRVALISKVRVLGAAAIPPKAPTSFCAPDEDVVFACRLDARLFSLCASRSLTPTSGYLHVLEGPVEAAAKPGLVLPSGKGHPAKATTGTSVAFAGGGGAWLRFHQGSTATVVYTGIGKWGPKGATAEKHGVVSERGGKAVNRKCAAEPESLLGPDWFAKAGVTARGEDFDFPN